MPGIRPLLVVFFLYNLALYVYPAIWAYFTQARFGWSPDIIGLSLALYGITSALVQTVLIRSLMRRWGERLTVLQGLFFDIGTCLLLAVVTSGTVALILTPLAAIGAVVTPALQGTMSRQVADDAQGELQGVLSSVNALAVILSTMIMTSVFAAFTAPAAPVQFAGAPFLLAALLLVIALVIYRRQVNAAAGAA